MSSPTGPTGTCADCGAPLAAASVPEALCPACTSRRAAASPTLVRPPSSTAKTLLASDGTDATRPDSRSGTPPTALPLPGQEFGGYRILRSLGKGGMGAVFEADHLESGRRVALKVLDRAIDSPETQKRFIREGRLAAAVNHPNSVYVFGTEEIGGVPAISMELVPGGTLQDRVQKNGPMPPGAAVDAILQVIAGLEAAQAKGVLHRDIKPSNCFVDADGTVKVGDFGLSVSTLSRGDSQVTAQGTFLGTPAYSSPEQLKGDDLDVRSDIYAVGVTLYYLLTARLPFDADTMVKLLATVLEKSPPPPSSQTTSAIPGGLDRIVLRCLQKSPAMRFAGYDDLRRALLPFGSAAPTAATLGLRFAAGLIDTLILSSATFVVPFALFGGPDAYAAILMSSAPARVGAALMMLLLWLLYYAVPEGLWGASAGKALCRLRLVRPDRAPVTLARTIPRCLLFSLAVWAPGSLLLYLEPERVLHPTTSSSPDLEAIATSYVFIPLLALMFAKARRHNGFAGLHDLATDSRVIQRPGYEARPTLALVATAQSGVGATPAAGPPGVSTIGPYEVRASLGRSGAAGLFLGHDSRLQRAVWIRVGAPDAAPVTPGLRAVGRSGRVRWLSGRRSESEAWDVYEAPSGESLATLIRSPQPWSLVRYWLLDLTEELVAARKEGTSPDVLAIDRVWITQEGRAKLLDFPAPTAVPGQDGSGGELSEPLFLKQVALSALEGREVRTEEVAALPGLRIPASLHARAFVAMLGTSPSPDAILGHLRPLLSRVPAISRGRRLLMIAGCAALPLLFGAGGFVLFELQRGLTERFPDLMPLHFAADEYDAFSRDAGDPESKESLRLLEIYVSRTFRHSLREREMWESIFARSLIRDDQRRNLERMAQSHPDASAADIAAAELKWGGEMEDYRKALSGGMPGGSAPVFILFAVTIPLLFFVAFPSLLFAGLFRGGPLVHLLGLAFVTGTGAPASRGRLFLRELVVWSPVLAMPFTLALGESAAPAAGVVLAFFFLAGAAISVASKRSLQDRLAGTWVAAK